MSGALGQAFLRHLQRTGVDLDVVFIDMDALVVAPVAPLFAPAGAPAAFDYAVTLSDAVDMCAYGTHMVADMLLNHAFPQAWAHIMCLN